MPVAILVCASISLFTGIVLGVVSHGGLLLATNQITAGDLMSFLVATQTIQRYSDHAFSDSPATVITVPSSLGPLGPCQSCLARL